MEERRSIHITTCKYNLEPGSINLAVFASRLSAPEYKLLSFFHASLTRMSVFGVKGRAHTTENANTLRKGGQRTEFLCGVYYHLLSLISFQNQKDVLTRPCTYNPISINYLCYLAASTRKAEQKRELPRASNQTYTNPLFNPENPININPESRVHPDHFSPSPGNPQRPRQ